MCLARCSTLGFDRPVIVKNRVHCHPSKPGRILGHKAINEMKYNSNSCAEKPRKIIHQALQDLPDEAVAVLPSNDAFRQRLFRFRNKDDPYDHLVIRFPKFIK